MNAKKRSYKRRVSGAQYHERKYKDSTFPSSLPLFLPSSHRLSHPSPTGMQSIRQDEDREVSGTAREQLLLRQAVARQERVQGIGDRGGRVRKRGRFLMNVDEEKEEDTEWAVNGEAGNKSRSRKKWGRGGGGGGRGDDEWERGRGGWGGERTRGGWKRQGQRGAGRSGGGGQGQGGGRGGSECNERGQKPSAVGMALESKLGMSLDELVKRGQGK